VLPPSGFLFLTWFIPCGECCALPLDVARLCMATAAACHEHNGYDSAGRLCSASAIAAMQGAAQCDDPSTGTLLVAMHFLHVTYIEVLAAVVTGCSLQHADTLLTLVIRPDKN
jgi:hypothetical protein